MSGGHNTNLKINRKMSASLHKHAVSSNFNYENYKINTRGNRNYSKGFGYC